MLASNLTAIPERLGLWNWTQSDKVTVNVGNKRVPFKGKEGDEARNVAIIHVSSVSSSCVACFVNTVQGKVDLAHPESQDGLR